MTRQTKGIILQKRDFRENDRLFVVYSEDLGKIEAVARGVKKIKSKLAGHLDYFSEIDFMLAPGKRYYQIAGAQIRNNFLKIKSDLQLSVFVSHSLEAVHAITKTEQKDRDVYNLLRDFLYISDNIDSKRAYGFSKFLVFKLFSISGFSPELFNCIKCRKKINFEDNFFSSILGGLVCDSCYKKLSQREKIGIIPIAVSSIKVLRYILNNSLQKIANLRVDRQELTNTVKIIDIFVKSYLDEEFKSEIWVNKLIFGKKLPKIAV